MNAALPENQIVMKSVKLHDAVQGAVHAGVHGAAPDEIPGVVRAPHRAVLDATRAVLIEAEGALPRDRQSLVREETSNRRNHQET